MLTGVSPIESLLEFVEPASPVIMDDPLGVAVVHAKEGALRESGKFDPIAFQQVECISYPGTLEYRMITG